MSYKNLKEETLIKIKEIGKTLEDIEYGTIIYDNIFDDAEPKLFIISNNLDFLDFTYDAGYGNQKVKGDIVFTDNSWLERAEYDGSEWWEYKKTPERYKGVINGT